MSWRDDDPLPDEGFGYEYELELEAELDKLEALPVVKSVKVQPKFNRVIVNLWCRSQHSASGDKQPNKALNSKKYPDDPEAVPTYLVATQKLIEKIENGHAGCVGVAEQAKAASNQSAAPGLCASSNAIEYLFLSPPACALLSCCCMRAYLSIQVVHCQGARSCMPICHAL